MDLDVLQILLFLVLLIPLAIPLGSYIAKVFTGEKTFLDILLNPVESVIYRVTGVTPNQEMTWKEYALSLILFNLLGIAVVVVWQILQGYLPLNPEGMKAVSLGLAFNTAASFVTNTNWQAYAGETTMSYFTQMGALSVQNFLSAATGLVVAIAVIRGISRNRTDKLGNFWVDLTRGALRVLLPLSLVLAVFMVSQGVIQNFYPYKTVQTLEGAKQTIPMGPVASQEAIKMVGVNGGGFFNANSAHPFENPTPLSNFAEMLAIFIIPASLTITFGHMVGNRRQGVVILIAMLLLFSGSLAVLYGSELNGNPSIAKQGVSSPTVMEGKEVRFGPEASSLFATVTTAASCGAVNASHDSLTPLGGLITLLQMMLGEVVFGGVGSGLYGMLMFVILTVFVVGLMVGRTPEYIGKKIESFDVKMATLAILIPSVSILVGTAIAAISSVGTSSVINPGPHGFSEMLYAFTSASANNGSAFAGLNANTPFYNITLAIAMLVGRFGVIIPALAIAGNLAEKQSLPPSAGTFDTTNWLFPILLMMIVIIIGALTFFPAIALGPIIEHLSMVKGGLF
ncbi:MAG: potassium-transporting ATPase subunit KdpA [Acidobacteriota bacterium]